MFFDHYNEQPLPFNFIMSVLHFLGLISCGDEVIEVNGVNVEGKTPNDVLRILVTFLAAVKMQNWVSCYSKFELLQLL